VTSPSRFTLHFSRTVVFVLAAAVVLPWAALIIVLLRDRPAATTPAVARARVAEPDLPPGASAVRPGPWGELFARRVLIEPPDNLLPPPMLPNSSPTWVFRNTTAAQLRAWFETLPLTAAQKAELLSPANWDVQPDLIRIRRSEELVLGLSPEARAKLYTRLAEFADNPEQALPFRFRADVADEWFAESGLPAETIERVKRLLYRRGTSLIFSDLSSVLPHIATQSERKQLLKTLSRKSTLMVRLRIAPDTDIAALEDYWGRGQRSRDLTPLLRSHQSANASASIDVIHLLPRIPRQLLYTYPLPDEKGRSTFLDCHWTTLNFFNLQPDQRFESIDEVKRTYLEDYYVLTGKPTFGDVVMLMRRDNSVVHSCILIADDIVYTKNGGQPSAPWILMSLSDVVAFYPSEEPLIVQYYRSKRVAVSP
jgi:hypothetical protein